MVYKWVCNVTLGVNWNDYGTCIGARNLGLVASQGHVHHLWCSTSPNWIKSIWTLNRKNIFCFPFKCHKRNVCSVSRWQTLLSNKIKREREKIIIIKHCMIPETVQSWSKGVWYIVGPKDPNQSHRCTQSLCF